MFFSHLHIGLSSALFLWSFSLRMNVNCCFVGLYRSRIFQLPHLLNSFTVTMLWNICFSKYDGIPWSWVILENARVSQPLKNFPTFDGTRRFITLFIRAPPWSLSWARWIQSVPPHFIYLRCILILSSHLRLDLPSGLYPSRSPTNMMYAFLFSPCVLHALPISARSFLLYLTQSTSCILLHNLYYDGSVLISFVKCNFKV
jgi:hypothetical protein